MILLQTRNGMPCTDYVALLDWVRDNALSTFRFTKDGKTPYESKFEHPEFLGTLRHTAYIMVLVDEDSGKKSGMRNGRFLITDASVAEKLRELWPKDVKISAV